MSEPISALKLVVGLGNPGPRYTDTRHNVGFWLVDELAEKYHGRFRSEAKFGGEACRIRVNGQELWLLKPMTFMNRSGYAVARLVGFYKIPLSALLVVHDDLDLPPGTVRLKRGGGHGGHNGLRDLVSQLGGNEFFRLRLGIGHPGDSREVTDYVLRRAPREQEQAIEQAIEAAVKAFPLLVEGQFQKTMNLLHRKF